MNYLILLLIIVSCGEVKILKENNSSVDEKPRSSVKPNCKSYCENKKLFQNESHLFQTLSFPNFGYRGIGRCRGYALLTQRFIYLARYSSSDTCPDNNCEKYNYEGIEKIMRGMPFVFKGVRNLYELSQNKQIEEKLRTIISRTSNRYTARSANIRVTDRDSEHSNIFSEILLRLKNNEKSYIGVHGNLTGHHALLSIYSSWKNHLEVICVIDPNIVVTELTCDNYLYEDHGEVFYKRYDREADKLSKFKLTQDEDIRTNLYQISLFQDCINTSSSRNYCYINE